MTSQSVTLNDSVTTRIVAWMNERFPFANALLFFILYLTSAAVARAALDQEIKISLLDVFNCLITWGLFLVIRIFDEHKDYDLDVLNHPQRVLQSGLITLKHLKILAAVSITAQLIFSLYLDGFILGSATISWLIMFGYLCLMGVEFFCGEWLEKRLTLYAFTHMMIMPLTVFWLANIATPSADITDVLTPSLYIMMLLAFVSGFCFEIARKTRGPEEERETVDSYSKIFGTKGSAYVVMGLITGMLISQALLLFFLSVEYIWAYSIALVVTYALAIKQVLSFVSAPSLKGREKNEAAIAINMLVGYLVIIIAVLINNGIAWSII
ncbi:MAG: 4-hydroxybenzoate polyprenyltransferase [Oleispira sp.]|jgi:4-hydroxybenzoate polyprenyltransferase